MSDNSEFACEVVRIASVERHPGADKLDLLHFYMAGDVDSGEPRLTGYTCVGQRGGFAPGDLAVYCSVDAVVPTARPEFEFLTKRPDGEGKTHFRLRAAKLRGVYSEGLLVPAPTGATIGDDMAEAWGVTQHQPPQPHVPGPGGPTPPSRVPHWLEALVPEYGVVSLRKVPHLFAPGEPVLVTEKIHGTNFRFGWVRRQWVVGSHRTFKTEHRSLWRRFTDWLSGKRRNRAGYYGAVGGAPDLYTWVAGDLGLREKCREMPGVVFYGEIYGLTPSGARVQDLTYGAARPVVRLFDAYDTSSHTWLTRMELVVAAADLDLPEVVPLVGAGPYDEEAIRRDAEGYSLLDPCTIREGVVVESPLGGKKGKWVSEGYRLRKGG